MFIKNIEVENFRSFRELSIQPSSFNVLIGPNASGKSNFLQMFRFLRDIVNIGLEDAISMQGGIEYLQNIQAGSQLNDTIFKIDTEYRNPAIAKKIIKGKKITIKPLACQLSFSIRYNSATNDYIVAEDHLVQTFDFEIEDKVYSGGLDLQKSIRAEDGTYSEKRELFFTGSSPESLQLEVNDIVSLPFATTSQPTDNSYHKHLFLENIYYMPYPQNLNTTLKDIPIYDLDLLKDNTDSSIIGRTKLEDNGDNIAIVLKKLLNDSAKKREFFNYVRYILPFIEDIEVERILDKHLQIKYRESYIDNSYMPASLMSSGTITLLAIIIGIFFEDNRVIVFEEPGGRIHPYLISRIINMMHNMHAEKQIFLTTHNPEIVKYAGIDNVFCLSRNKSGFSTIDHLSQKKDIMQFLENEIGLDELFIQNLLLNKE